MFLPAQSFIMVLLFLCIIVPYLDKVSGTASVPWITSAGFSNHYDIIQLTFNTSHGYKKSLDCANILNPASIGILGDSPKCLVKSDDVIILIPDANSNLQRDGALETIGGNDSQIFIVTSTADEPTPMLHLSQVKKTCICDSDKLWFNLYKSTNLGYGTLKDIRWSIKEVEDPTPSYVLLPSSFGMVMNVSNATMSHSNSTYSVSFNASLAGMANSLAPDISSTSLDALSTSIAVTQSSSIEVVSSSSATQSSSIEVVPNSSATQSSSLEVVPSSSVNSSGVASQINVTNSYNVSSMSSSISATPTIHQSRLQIALSSQQDNAEINLDSSLFYDNYTYTLYISAKNTFDRNASVQSTFHFKKNCLPYVDLVQDPILTIIEYVLFKVNLHYPKCLSQHLSLTYLWDIKSDGVSISPGSSIDKSFLTVNTQIFNVNLNYTIIVSVTMQTQSSAVETIVKEHNFNMQSITHTNQQSSMVRILGGNRFVGVNETKLKLVTSSNINGISYLWSCKDDDNQPCSKDGNVISFEQNKVLEFKIEDGDFEVDKTYLFTLVANKGGDTWTDTAQVSIINHYIYFYVSTKKIHDLPHGTPLLFTAMLSGQLDGTYIIDWICYDQYDDTMEDVIPADTQKLFEIEIINNQKSFQYRAVHLHLPKKLEKFVGLNLVCKSTLKHDSKSYTSNDKVTFSVPLRKPGINVSPSSGTASETRFHIVAHGWSASPNSMLLFRFGYESDDENVIEKYLTDWTTSNSLENIFFPLFASADTFQLKVFVLVKTPDAKISRGVKTITLQIPANTEAVVENLQMLKNQLDYSVTIDAFTATQYLYNRISLFDDEVEETDTTKTAFLKYLDLIMSLPPQGKLLEDALDVTRLFIHKTHVEMGEDVFNKTTNFLAHTSMHFYMIQEPNNTFAIVNLLLQGRRHQPLHLLPMLSDLTKLGRQLCTRMDTPDVKNGLITTQFPLLNITVKRERFYSHISDTILVLLNDITNYTTWNCQDNPQEELCNGLCITQVEYDRKLYVSLTNYSKDWRMVSNVYDIHIWNPRNDDNDEREINTTGPVEYFDVILPSKDDTLTENDNLYCQILDPNRGIDNTSLCDSARYVGDNGGEIHCRCQRLGKITAFKEYIEYITTTESPFLGDNVTFSLYFYAPKSMCIFPNKWKFFKQKLLPVLALALNINANRITFTGCNIGSIIVHIHILDEIGARRNINLEGDITRMVARQDLSITMKAGTFNMFDVDQTTPKPPPPTIPPIGEVDTDWVPIGISIGVILFVFILCGVITCMIHTRYLKNKVFTEVNSDKNVVLSAKEEIELETRNNRTQKMNTITEDAIDGPDELTSSTLSLSKKSKRGSIHPVGDKNAIIVSSLPSYYRQSASLAEQPRLALDDSSDEETPESRSTSTAALFRASSVSIRHTGDDGTNITSRDNAQNESSF